MEIVDWGNLEALPLSLIFDKLVESIDHIYFSLVCKNWYSTAKFNHQNRQIKNNVLPMLMIPTRSKCRTKRCLYGISSKTVYPFQLHVPYNKRLCGSSHGWIARLDCISKLNVITLLNPFKKLVSIPLPPIDMPYEYMNIISYECNVHKVVLSSNPTFTPHDYIVVAIYTSRNCLAFIKAGQKVWTYIDHDYFCFSDVIFYKGLVYAVGRWNQIVSFDVCNSKGSLKCEYVIPNVVSSWGDNYAHRSYLVESLEGDLWLVRKFISYPEDDNLPSSGAKKFEVYKLELDFQSAKLIQMLKLDTLGDNVLFVGDSESISLSASYFANYLQKDSIYYTDDFYDDTPRPYPAGPLDMKIYNVRDGSFSQHCPYKPWFRRTPPALWVFPPFQRD
ncbi:F-box protein SKIP23-like [Vicia villosa]|uniref:F-box protein SKIP23-like n=1 Tax=Vicia villosa TaxID=3911 RepID=UPI00273C334B|nr:F-box protein SKIP23-like [Vicia villosa]